MEFVKLNKSKVIKMKFEHVLMSKASIKKKKYYDLTFSDEDIKKGRKATEKNPYYLDKSLILYIMYNEKGKLNIKMFHSFDAFKECVDKKKL